MYDYPHTIDNGAGERLTFLGRRSDERGEYLEVENEVSPGAGPPMHVHYRQEEGLTVIEGRIGWQESGKEEQFAEAGETVVFAPGMGHRFWNAGEGPLRCRGYIRPPDNIEYFLTEIYASVVRNGGDRPHPFDAAYLLQRYSSEFGMLDIPSFVQRVIFPVQLLIGKAQGRHRRFASAPAPIAAPRT